MGCAGPDIHFDYDVKANYQSYHAYDWYAAPKTAPGNPLLDQRVRRAVEAELALRGFKREITADPEFLVTYYPAFAARRRSRGAFSIGLGMGGPVGLGLGIAAPLTARSAGQVTSIVLEIQDFKTHQLIWKAAAADVLDGTEGPEDADAAVAEAVKKMLKRFPPTATS
jgi:hypothetical protein